MTVESQTEALYQSLEAMEQMVALFYQHKGLTDQEVPEEYGTSNSLSLIHISQRHIQPQRLPGLPVMKRLHPSARLKLAD